MGQLDVSQYARRRLGPIEPPVDSRPEAVILDGQNRLATVAWLMHQDLENLSSGITDHERHVWGTDNVPVVNIENHQVSFVSREAAGTGFVMPARVLFGGAPANELIRERWNTQWASEDETKLNAAVRWLDKAQTAVSDARVVVTSLQGASVQDAKDAFLHICKVGVPMSLQDLEAALAWTAEQP